MTGGAAVSRRTDSVPLFAHRAEEFRPSPVRAVFEIALQPGMISLAGGNPDMSALPHQVVADMAARILAERGPEVLQYGSGAGIGRLPELIVELMGLEGAEVAPDRIQITAGSQAGLDLVTKLYCDPGDVVVAEGPTYVGALGVFGSYEVDVEHVDVDDDGLDPEAVAERIDGLRAAGRTVKFVYTVPNFSNPTGVTTPEERRRRLVDVCAERGVLVLEDDPYGLLGFDRAHRLPSLYSLAPDTVIHLGSFSKIFSPGLRVGWIAAAPAVRARLQIAAEAVTIHPSVLSQELAAAYVASEHWRPSLDRAVALYRSRCAAMMEALETHMPEGVRWTRPAGGFFTWLELGPWTGGGDLLRRAVDHGVVLVPGGACYADGRATTSLRLAYSATPEAEIAEGVRRVGEMLRG
ncbi:aminotransferase class I/II-fold pyridoxal phosphate-dependent enzyme [Kocuria sediminis]|uniref:Aminotransferase class I/II-fold pyridoxal phosphate-dependent enzyme n=1 Tax=Kocuria sediminis TaxID=1038857 RepID=A0A6N8GQ11_9MICC|nr:aminotransferase class I/II-fold pyridoxal phosphate-dependent enzyme [Kocuria sediminis]